MTDIIERAEAALEGITGGPWEWDSYGGLTKPYDNGGAEPVLWWDCIADEIDGSIEDMGFIAAARSLVPELLAELKSARAETERVPVPDRAFTDDLGRQWEWFGGVPGTWAWRITRLPHETNRHDPECESRRKVDYYDGNPYCANCGALLGGDANG